MHSEMIIEKLERVIQKYEESIESLFRGDYGAYLMMKEALVFGENQKKEIKNARRISDSSKLEES